MAESNAFLETDRLTMRPHVLEDFNDSFAMWSDPEVIRFIGGQPFTREEVWARLLRYAGHWKLLGFGYWAVREKAGGRFVGEVGFANFRRQIEPPLDDMPEVGWALTPTAQGRGYATEAVRAALRWADAKWPAADTACIIAPENAPSLRVAQKSGYTEWTRGSYKGKPTIHLRRAAGSA
ncbi:GNAT family N-acetyltransferase [Paraburkholderia sp. BCC1885]|uniref:GNAT family N-acetyltransferase n=1 Tax=Paraburkholderia sp. BCC1885 TaxID=2562669 RepID=UPI00118464B1|nr:GNAT family N-acetyltransferase [Paraburkholderia sp. BCC1885]